jgi:thermostable 8-oxoguanine DNA glycosylase
LGSTLREEVAACLLGGHGIPASVGIAAFDTLKTAGMFGGDIPEIHELEAILSSPINLNGHLIRYRFARQKARYLHAALIKLSREEAPERSGKSLRNWLLDVPGIGFKTASWIARNWLGADDVAILDIHIYRAGIIGGYFDTSMTVEKDYLSLEEQFIKFSNALGVRTSELDAVVWYEMMASPTTVHRVIDESDYLGGLLKKGGASRTNKRQPYAEQPALFV